MLQIITHHLFFLRPYPQTAWRGANISHHGLIDPTVDLDTKIKANYGIDVDLAKNDSRDWLQALELQEDRRQWSLNDSLGRLNRRWKHPHFNWIKCNFDGSFFNNTSFAKIRWLYRDDSGIYLGAAHSIGVRLSSPLEAEYEALLMAIQHVWIKGYQRINLKEIVNV